MSSDWRRRKWGDIATLEYGKSLREYQGKTAEYPVYGTNGLIGSNAEPLCKHAGVIIGRKGAYRGVHYSPKPFYVIDTAFYLEPKTDIDMRWAYYALLTQDINAMDSGSAIPSTSRTDFYSLPVKLPAFGEQQAIAQILGTLDDKIELNRRMNETLEAMARAIFQSWFVDFDPVRAKAAGREPFGMNAETAALFPTSLEDSPHGKIPKGWKFVSLPEAVEINPMRSLRKGEATTYLDMQNMPTSGHRVSGWTQRSFVSGSKFANGDTLVARITPCLENGKTAFVDFLQDREVAWGSTEFIVLRPKKRLPPEYGYCLARDEAFRTHAIQNMTGSSGRQRVVTGSLSQYFVAVPSESVAHAFGLLIQPFFAKAKANSEEATTLAAIRDALLPKLISGEIRIKDAEKMVGEKV